MTPGERRAAVDLAIRQQLWRMGDLSFKRDEGQRAWVEHFWSGDDNAVWLVGRQRGKSHNALGMALELGLRQPGSIIRYCAKTKDSAWGIVGPNLRQIMEDKPDAVRIKPSTLRSDVLEIGDGSELIIFGTDAQSFDRGRGPRTHLQLFDECGFYQDLERVEAALLPSLQTTAGKALYLSTPPESMGHPYVQRIRAAKAAGRLVHDTFWSNPRIDHEAIIRQEATRLGMTRDELLASTYFRREYLAELVTEESRAAVPSWNEEMERRTVVSAGDWKRPEHFDGYVALDIGSLTGDPHAALFGFYEFASGTLWVEDELEMRGTTEAFVKAAKAKEVGLWGLNRFDGTLLGADTFEELPEWLRPIVAKSKSAPRQPFLRVGDNDALTLGDMLHLHGYAVIPTQKHHKALAADEVDTEFRRGRIRIHERCVRLRQQLHTTVWNKARTEWERTPLDHGDLVDDLLYMVRNLRRHRDPRPAPQDLYFPGRPQPQKDAARNLAMAFGSTLRRAK